LAKVNPSAAEGDGDAQMQEFFRRFFGVPMPQQPQRPDAQTPQEQPRGIGSGFILSSDGYILTNAHVVDDADELIVTLTDKREFKAKLIGLDKRTDVALVKIPATGLRAVRIGNVAQLKVGEWVMAIGSPFGLDNTVTAGIVSAKQRDTGDFLPFIQTDVAINPGNSGGPLINMRGEVVGINSQIYSRSGGFMGISFAIPIDEAMRVSEQLKATGRVQRGRIGVQIDQVGQDIAQSLGLGKARGALVRRVEPGSPAEKAGVQVGDIIVRFDGHEIEKVSDLPRVVANLKPGTSTTMQVWRQGQVRDLRITVAALTPDIAKAPGAESTPSTPAQAQGLGMTVRPLSEAQLQSRKVRGGVLIQTVTPVAARAGLRADDVVLAIGNHETLDLQSFRQAVQAVSAQSSVSVLFVRGQWAQYTVIRPQRP
jgi:serine protease Do